jgi:hypothetical protein
VSETARVTHECNPLVFSYKAAATFLMHRQAGKQLIYDLRNKKYPPIENAYICQLLLPPLEFGPVPVRAYIYVYFVLVHTASSRSRDRWRGGDWYGEWTPNTYYAWHCYGTIMHRYGVVIPDHSSHPQVALRFHPKRQNCNDQTLFLPNTKIRIACAYSRKKNPKREKKNSIS